MAGRSPLQSRSDQTAVVAMTTPTRASINCFDNWPFAADSRAMEIHQLRYFVAVAEEGSFSQAAEREHVSQPSLSQQIQKLEDELNQKLFDRLPRAVVLTEAGQRLLDYARQILSGIADARRSVAAVEQEVAGRLSVGAVLSIALYVLPRLIRRFQQ